MCRNRASQIEHIQKNLLVYIHREDNQGNYIPVGTGFLISNDGTIMTAKHNIDFSLTYRYWALYRNKYYEIHKKNNTNYQYAGVDIMVVKTDINLNLSKYDFLSEYTMSENSLIAEEVVVIGFENNTKKVLCPTGTICGIDDGKYEIQNGNMGVGCSGAPVILKRDLRTLIGVMSKREGLSLDLTNYKIKSDKFGIGYAHSINLFHKNCLTETSKNNNIIFNLLSSRDLKEWEMFFCNHIKEIYEQYKKIPNPMYIYNKFFIDYKIKSISLNQFCEFMFNNRLFLFSIGRLYELIGNILINSGIISILSDARHHLNCAKIMYENSNINIEESIKRIIRVNWLISITYKLERNYGRAFKICEDITKDYRSKCEKLLIPYSSGLILPEREIAILEQQRGYFKTLKNKDYLYETDILETFFTNRRIFEFSLSQHNTKEAKSIYPDLMNSFQKSKHKLEPIYKYTLAKNLYHYNTLLNNTKSAKKFYTFAYNNFKHWGLIGQQKAILKIKDNLNI